jgi:hypothetical protein
VVIDASEGSGNGDEIMRSIKDKYKIKTRSGLTQSDLKIAEGSVELKSVVF